MYAVFVDYKLLHSIVGLNVWKYGVEINDVGVGFGFAFGFGINDDDDEFKIAVWGFLRNDLRWRYRLR